MSGIYLTGSSLICALGNSKKDCIEKIKTIDSSNYNNIFDKNKNIFDIFKINQKFESEKTKFFTLLKEVVLSAIEDAKLSVEDKEELGIFIGSTAHSITLIEEVFENYYHNKSDKMFEKIGYSEIGTFIEELVGSKYKATSIQTACTSTSNALIYASNYIKQNRIKKALIVGFEVFNKSTYEGFNSLMLLSKSGVYKPFDKTSDGLILGEAFSAIIVEDKRKNENDFEILSSNIEFDNTSITGSNPNGEHTFKSMQKALEKANLGVSDLTCIKAHATGSENSNQSEAKAIDKLFTSYNAQTDVVILKPFLGHTLGACGSSEIVLLTELIKNGFLPKTLNFNEGYENISFKPLCENKAVKDATILFQFIGFGGSNSTVIMSNKAK